MNLIIEEQLKKCKVAKIPQFDETTTHLIIPKQEGAISCSTFQINEEYIIKLESYILNPPEGFTLHTNWNNNIPPKSEVLYCKIIQVMGKMIKIHGMGYNYSTKQTTDYNWEGWLPIKSVKVLEKIYKEQ